MPTTFDKREEEFEKRFAHDEELRFKAIARRNKMLGLWAAEKLGLSGADAERDVEKLLDELAPVVVARGSAAPPSRSDPPISA